MIKSTAMCSSSARRSRVFVTLAALVLLALSASACASGSVDIGGSVDSESPAQPTNNTADEPRDVGVFGPKPVLQTFRISADTILVNGDAVGFDYTFTDISDQDQNLRYIAIGSDTAIRASYLSQGPNRVEVCVETAAGCGGGDPSDDPSFAVPLLQYFFEEFGLRAEDGPRVPGGVLLGETVGWEISNDSYSLDGRPGRCYRSLGFYQFPGDPEPTETRFPAGDIACVLFSQTTSEYVVSYDFGGDGTIEIQAIRLADSYTEADFVHPDYAPAEFDQTALMEMLEIVSLDGVELLATS